MRHQSLQLRWIIRLDEKPVKDVVHVWEIGHLTSSLVSAAMLGSALTHSPHHVTLMIMLDLSTPQSLWSTLDESLTVARSAMKMSYDSRIVEEMKNARVRERKKETETEVDPFPMRLCILGGKYDKFKEFDMERKQLVDRTLRAVAHCLGASLQYHSSRDTVLIRRTKDLLAQYGFGTQPNKGVCLDYEKPLVVPAGADSFSSINFKLPHGRPAAIIDTIKQFYVGSIPQDIKTEESNLEDPANDPNFQEPIIDRLRSQREEEISILLQDMLEGHTPKIAIPEPL
ncbi:cytoplasmic dynein 2 light intermediate chain 1 isoform X2 [Cephus cinctus]|uniref:Cytoplasmic dynein 2 light intermediate chain 1 isoform X2 n=1 Tax=Cephus cinctus TaxID=211228 RepID=A0AAJ7FU50_CEPCN|nr:cytoplasmic dynein 2 light intermediate chain 1 isoform X2 [Cephus cinctus]